MIFYLTLATLVVAAAKPLPKALLINLPRHTSRYDEVKQQLDLAGVSFERIVATDGRALSEDVTAREVTRLGRLLMTKGMMGCYLSHRSCWQKCLAEGSPVIVFEDDVVLGADFTDRLEKAMDSLPEDWDVLLLGALGAVHPSKYHVTFLHALGAGGLRWPRWITADVHTPMRPFGTHAYVVSAAGANKLLTHAPRASYHVDVVAWGMRCLKLYAVHPLLAKQTHADTTIGGSQDRSWIPSFTIDDYTGADFAWAWNAPLMQFGGAGGVMLTSGRWFFTTLLGLVLAAVLRSRRVLAAVVAEVAAVMAVMRMLTWPQAPRHRDSARAHLEASPVGAP